MERKIVKRLEKWKNEGHAKPLLIHGARQVGKTYSVLEFGRTHYSTTLYISLEDSREFAAVFERDLDPDRIVRELAALTGQTVNVDDTLIIFDEIQASPRALTSLKYFAEGKTRYHVIATGSLLGISVKQKDEPYSFPVGKVDIEAMYPMDFEEFCWALDQAPLLDLIRDAYVCMTPLSLHQHALDLYRQHLAIGGMPEVVETFIHSGDLNRVVAAHKRLNDSAIADMAKYATSPQTARILSAWSSMPAQLAKDNHRFHYSLVRPGARASQYEWAIQWLVSAGLVINVPMVVQGRLPLSAHIEPGTFKLYMYDTGVLTTKLEIPLNQLLHTSQILSGFSGALTENYVAQSFAANLVTPYYWASPGKAEVDFVYQTSTGDIVPVEVKAGDNTRSKSLSRFIELYHPKQAVRVSTRNFGDDGIIRSVPVYAVWLLTT